MRRIIIDSSSLILLYKCNMIQPLIKYCIPVIPCAVLREITVPGRDGAWYFADLHSRGALKVCLPDSAEPEDLSVRLHAGERDVIKLFREGRGDYIIIDDMKGALYCRENRIPYINALLAAKILYFENIISEVIFTGAWAWLLENGRYSSQVRLWAEKADRDLLAYFISQA